MDTMQVVAEFDAKLRTIVDYESVSQDVAQYNKVRIGKINVLPSIFSLGSL